MKNWKRGAFALVAVALAIIFATPAMAIISTGRSEVMVFQSECDKAGTLDLKFNEDDVRIMAEYLADDNTPKLDATLDYPITRDGEAPYVLIEVTLSALNISNQVSPAPFLCKDIQTLNTDTLYGADDEPLPDAWQRAVPLHRIAKEVSDIVVGPLSGGGDVCNEVTQDITAYVYGEKGEERFYIIITDIENNAVGEWDDQNKWPWLKVGLDETEVGDPLVDCIDGHHTTICADVSGYNDADDLATLNVNLDIEPEKLTYTTSDSQIGHFNPYNLQFDNCPDDKFGGDRCDQLDTEYIELCELPDQGICKTYYKCIRITGITQRDNYKFIVRTNGESASDDDQQGVYLYEVAVYQGDDELDYYMYGGNDDPQRKATFYGLRNGLYTDDYEDSDDRFCTFRVEYWQSVILEEEIDFTEAVKLCIQYQVDANSDDIPALGENVKFWVSVTTDSVCETQIDDDVVEGAEVVACGQLESCMYFPYVLVGYDASFQVGIGVSNLGEDVAAEDMEVTVQLFHENGTKYVGDLPTDMITGKVFAFTMDQMVEAMGWEVPTGRAWLWVTGNFSIDGYSYLVDNANAFGGTTLPRILDTCENILKMR